MAGFRCADRGANRFQIAQFSHEQHVGVLRRAPRKAVAKLGVSIPSSRCLNRLFFAGVDDSNRVFDLMIRQS
jgi:hypothetical protein